MFVIVGLGNPGSEYDGTRHNLGFAVVDTLAEKEHIYFRDGRGEYLEGSKRISGIEILLIKPCTFMNNSGDAVRDVVARHEVEPHNVLVIADDFQIPLGTLRLRRSGSDGGHNGLYSIIYHLQSDEFPRLRCGIGSESMPKNKNEMARFVLSPFDTNERTVVKNMADRASDAALITATEGIETAIRRFNRKKI